MISAKELREGNCNQETVERGLILIENMIRDNRMKRFVDVKLAKAFYNEYEFEVIVKELRRLDYLVNLKFNIGYEDETNLNREFTLRW